MARTLLGVVIAMALLFAAPTEEAAAEHLPGFCRGLSDSTRLGLVHDWDGESLWRLCRPVDADAEIVRFEIIGVDVDPDRYEAFGRTVVATLTDPRGWSAYGTGVRLQPTEADGDFTVALASPEAVANAGPVCSPHFSCRVGDTAWINERRWDEGVDGYAESGASLLDYRRMVINHEVGHWLGFGHEQCPGEGRRAPVMQQQSIDLDGCRPNPWPLSHERAAVGDR